MPIDFELWVDFCFTAGYKTFGGEPIDPRWKDVDDLDSIKPQELAGLITQLFEAPATLSKRFSRDQLADGVWYLFGIASESFKIIRDRAVPIDDQIRCYRSMSSLYRTVFDPHCRPVAHRRLSMTAINQDRLECAIYMIWDMDCVEGAAMSDKWPHLIDPCFEVLQTALDCTSAACKISALHGLGHLADHHGTRVKKMAGRLASNAGLPTWIRDYARAAMVGGVQ